jgi:hypothetical protein
MKRNLLTSLLFLLLTAGWMMAQTSANSQSNSSQTGQSQTGTSSQMGQDESAQNSQANAGQTTTLRGCLSQSAVGSGNFTLTSSTGTPYQLQGDTAQLSNHVGQEVQVKGTISSMSASNNAANGESGAVSGNTSGTNANNNTVNVTSVKKISSTCTSGNSSQQP